MKGNIMNRHAKLLKVKLQLIFMFFSLVPMLGIALYGYYDIKNKIIDSELSHLEAIAKLKSSQIERFYNRSENYIYFIQNSPYAKNILLAASSSESPNFRESKRLFQEQLNLFTVNNDLDEVYIISADGNVLVGSKKKEDDDFALVFKRAFEEGKRKTYMSDLYRGHAQNKSYLFTISAPILDSNKKLLGVVVAEFIANDFFKQIQDYSGLGSSGLSLDYRGVEVFAAWRYIPKVHWGMVAKIDSDEALKPLVSIRDSIVFTALFILILGIVVSYKMTNNLIRPVDHLETDAHIDSLTGLPNRKLLMGLLEQVLEKAKTNDSIVAVMFLDLDGFKSVNDTHGHEMGDLLLKNVAQRLTNCIRQSDTVARLGGDEFIVLLSGTHDINNVVKIADNIIKKLNEDFLINNSIMNIGASIGISIFPDNTTNLDEMLQMADKAMYEAKQHGKNHYKFYRENR